MLAAEGGALPELARPVRFGVGAALGRGTQPMPWLHIEDAVRACVRAVECDAMRGSFNVVAPQHASNAQVTQAVAKALGRPLWMPNVPEFAVRLLMGKTKVFCVWKL